jgi:hypothetical protein
LEVRLKTDILLRERKYKKTLKEQLQKFMLLMTKISRKQAGEPFLKAEVRLYDRLLMKRQTAIKEKFS